MELFMEEKRGRKGKKGSWGYFVLFNFGRARFELRKKRNSCSHEALWVLGGATYLDD